ncbi:hypothetical protein Pmani_035024 [Petrolisthes manimaculis]|uniref:Uncharacterized protein n=1 Tax=Petrolisthes manimaculis TaxID=1843537 RepID=A0AAE1NFB0_9EUCA|nr:hypothetical protein Pmani_039304 [Petrolisthes manimaculis]KAK4292188.1 hypothetical protein Pmani_035024 [Petrolisthes manimaculis]
MIIASPDNYPSRAIKELALDSLAQPDPTSGWPHAHCLTMHAASPCILLRYAGCFTTHVASPHMLIYHIC